MKLRKKLTNFDKQAISKINKCRALNKALYKTNKISDDKYLSNIDRLLTIISKCELKDRYIC